ncbi:RICIN domain-containing protein [Streptomyces sp. NPDC090022]|uniref:RICIN domain-containing protein n=1 Tax=Streptomyces sp. NPDC090022 TaxID=3365920 RepID=UPI003816FA58
MIRSSLPRLRSGALALAASACLVAGFGSAHAASSTGAEVVPGGAHQYRNAVTGKCLDVRGGSQDPNAVIQQFDCKWALNQQFVSQFTGSDPTTRLQPRHSGMCASAAGSWPGSYVTQQRCLGGPSERWELVDLGGGAVVVKNAFTGLCLDDAGWSDGSRREVRQAVCRNSGAQVWIRHAV